MSFLKKISFLSLILISSLCLSPCFAQKGDDIKLPDGFENLKIKRIDLTNTENGKSFDALVVTGPYFVPSQPRSSALTISLGAYGEPYNEKTFEDEFTTWIPVISEYIDKEPSAAVVVPDSEFGAGKRAGALDACLAYALDPDGEIQAQLAAVIGASLGAGGTLHLLENTGRRYTSVNRIFLSVFVYPREFYPPDLADANISRIRAPVTIHVGTAEADPAAQADASELFTALELYNPSLPKRKDDYRDGKHGFYVRYKGLAPYIERYRNLPPDYEKTAEAGAQAREKTFLDLSRPLNFPDKPR